MSDTCHDESALVERAVAGDADAFGALYSQHLNAIYRYVYFRVGNTRDAEDLTEQTFLKAWEALPDYNQRGNPFTSWLYRIAHNVVVDHHRRQKPIVSTSLVTTRVAQESKQPTALDQVIQAEEADALASAIAQLPDEYQQIIILRFVEGLRHTEVSLIMDKSEGACRVMQHRALAALNQLLTGMREE
jgi:RNA polymerase sigma-70 factor (ECF subfamily)